MEYIKTDENHTQLDTLENAQEKIEVSIKDTEEEIRNLRERLKNYKKQKSENNKQIKKHVIITENRMKHCLECGFIESKLKD